MKNCWWKERVFYQIYPRSFCDSNGDGIGDLQGIISKLDYLKWLGIGAIWLNPIYDSPNDDMGYDIRNYEEILNEFGTLKDFEQLLYEMHSRDIKLIMDLVVNHTSDEHRWFIESKSSKESPYRDYYIWKKGKDGKEPNNWSSFFTPSAWKYDDDSGEWYLHLFSEKQPDLNWENPSMRNDIYRMVNKWFDIGVDGFRMDVINLISKNPDYPDGKGIPNEQGYVFSDEYFAMQPALHTYLKEMREKCFDGRECMCVGEAPFVTTSNANTLVKGGRELDMIFQFDHMNLDADGEKWNVKQFRVEEFKKVINNWQHCLDWNTLFWGNHDQPRPVSRFGSTDTDELRVRSAKMLATVMYLLKGTPFIYQGEEIGMTNVPFSSPDDLKDIESIKYLENSSDKASAWKSILIKGRDNARTPMQWNDRENAGFSTGHPWIMINPNYININVENDLDNSKSILHYYQKLIYFRNSNKVMIYGDFYMDELDDKQLITYTRSYENVKYKVIANMSSKSVKIKTDPTDTIVLENVDDPDESILLPYEARVIKVLT